MAITNTEVWSGAFKRMSGLELCEEYESAQKDHDWAEIDRETGRKKADILAYEMAKRFYLRVTRDVGRLSECAISKGGQP